MLVLSGKEGEKIHIGKDIVVTFMSKRYGNYRVAIDAARDIPIVREGAKNKQAKTET